jgi:ABC-type nitrate/sulfonate/bicarbonate transport system substrate-binding protein
VVTPAPTVAPTPGPGGFTPPVAGQRELTVGYRQRGIRGRLPLLVAQARGYFQQAGFDLVNLVEVEEPIAGVLGGELDLGVITTVDAVNGIAQGLPLQVVAGYHNYRDGGDAYGGDVLAATSDLVAADPGTITAFLSAYLRALQDIADPASQEAILALADAAGIPVTNEGRREYAGRAAEYAPFDGGFGDRGNGGGLGELQAYLTAELDSVPDLSTVIAWPQLLVGQASQVLPSNPISLLLDPPRITLPRVGVPIGDADASLPFTTAQDLDAFTPVGLDGVEIVESETPIAALLAGEVDLAVVSAEELVTSATQGLPVFAVAGHRNVPGADATATVLAASSDLLDADPGTVTAVLRAYIAGLQALSGDVESPAAQAYAPFDGGFGPADDAGGLGSLAELAGSESAAAALVAWSSLVVAQTTLNLPANPTAAAIGPVPSWSATALAAAPDASVAPSPAS